MTQAAADLSGISKAIGEISEKLDELTRVVGQESADGQGGTGLVGDMRRATKELKSLTSLRDKGLGAVGAIALVLSLLGISFRQGIVSALYGGHK